MARGSGEPRVLNLMKLLLSKEATDWLRAHIRTMGPKSPIYKLLKEELTARGWWKNRPRGKPSLANLSVSGAKPSTNSHDNEWSE